MHSKITSSSLFKVLLKSSLPFLLGNMMSLLKGTFIGPQNISSNSHDPEILDLISKTYLTAYDSYFHFMIVMLLINLAIETAIILKKNLTRNLRENKDDDKNILDNGYMSSQNLSNEIDIKAKLAKGLKSWLLASLYYSCIFAFFSIIRIYAGSLPTIEMKSLLQLSQEDLSNSNENILINSRVLLEEAKEETSLSSDRVFTQSNDSDSSAITKEKISLSLGKLLGTLDMEACSLTLSKDNKLAFTIISYYQTLKIIDISDVHFPKIMTSYALPYLDRAFRTTSMLFSNDEKTLFMYDLKSLYIINMTNPNLPREMTVIFDNENFVAFEKYSQESSFKFPENFPASMALSKDEKILYLGGVGLQVYNITDLRNPSLISSISRNKFDETFVLNSLAISSDRDKMFIANGTLDIYNITDPTKISIITSYKTESAINSIVLSLDNQKAYVTGFSLSQNQTIIEELNIADLQSISKGSQKSLSLDGKTWRYPSIIAQSPKGSQLYIVLNSNSSDFELVVYNVLQGCMKDINQSIVQKPSALAFSADSEMVYTVSKNKFSIMELDTTYPNKRIFSLLNNSIEEFGVKKAWKITLISDDNKLLFAAYNDSVSSMLEIWNISNRVSPKMINSFSLFAPIINMQLSPDVTKAYIHDTESLFVLDLSDFKNPKALSTIHQKAESGFPIITFTVSYDGKFAFLMFASDKQANMTVFDIQANKEIQSFIVEDQISIKQNSCKLVISKDNKFLFIIMNRLYICKITPGGLKGISHLSLAPDYIEQNIYSATLSSDNKVLFIENYNHIKFRKLTIVNLKNFTAPKIFSELPLPSVEEGITFPLYLNEQSAYVYQDLSLLKIDLTNLASPKIFGMIPLSVGKGGEISSVVMTADGLTGFVSTKSSKVHVLTLQENYTVLINQESFMLGEKYSDHVNLLKISDQGGDYQPVRQGTVKFLRLFLVDFKTEADKLATEMTFFAAPYWMNFDKENYILTLDPKKQSDIGTYTMYFAFSKKIPLDCFNGVIESIDSPEKSHDLMALLISMGYVDNQRFLTSSFGYVEDFIVPSNWTSQGKQIYDVLRKYYIDTCNQFDIVSSLDVLGNEKLEITSTSTNMLKVDITLLNNSNVKFLNKPYASLQPVIIDKKSRLLIEGPLKDINHALREVVINMEQENLTCDGQITVADGLNYPVTRDIENIQNYFKKNGAPKLKKSVQEQIDVQALARPILTGNYLSIILNEKTFEDENSENLSYELILQGKNASLPNWITIHGFEIQGTPPEELFGRDISLYLVASNEFKRIEEPFTLHINLSSGFIGKLLLRYSPYILTILTLWINANRIYNILAKKRYRHIKDVNLVAGEKVDANVVFPIYFIAEENRESQFLLGKLKKKIGSLEKFAMNEVNGGLNKSKILRNIKEIVNEMSEKEKEEKLSLYTSKSSSKKQLINQLLINEIVLKGQLELKSEKLTKSVFENLKDQWINVIEWDSSGFAVNEEKLNSLLNKEAITGAMVNSDKKKGTTSIQLIPTAHHSIQESLLSENEESLNEPDINLHLLKNAMIAHIFNLHSLKKLAIKSDVVIKQKVRMNWVFRFIKYDLKNIYLNEKSKIDYGINYKIKDDILFFYGEVDSSLVGKTLVVQITDPRSRILKEIWMHGKSNDDCDSSADDLKLREPKDEKYEVF